MMSRVALLAVLLVTGPSVVAPAVGYQKARDTQEESESHHKKWLSQDIIHIITPEEKAVFEKLQTPEERDSFIEQFWQRRDPDPRTPENEFKVEHYRRIAYANQHFAAGYAGWETDRGKVYIKYGPPDEIERHPTGGRYTRKAWEGGGQTSTFPFEVWWYRHIPGVGSNVEIEFVDKSMSGSYKIALNAEEKDALLMVGGAGPTEGEGYGFSSRDDRLLRRSATTTGESDPFLIRRQRDMPLHRLEEYMKLQRAPAIQFTKLKEIVTTQIHYDNQVKFAVTAPSFVMDREHLLVPLTVQVPLAQLSFEEALGHYRAQIELYGSLTTLTGQMVAEFEDVITSDLSPEKYRTLDRRRAFYQKQLVVKPGRYKATVIVKDAKGEQLGVVEKGVVAPQVDPGQLTLSPVVLSHVVGPAEGAATLEQQFVLGPYKVIPDLTGEIEKSPNLAPKIYFHVYNVATDSATNQPWLALKFRLFSKGRQLAEIEKNDAIRYVTGDTAVVATALRFGGLEEGDYRCEVDVFDEIAATSARSEFRFRVVGRTPVGQ